MPSTSYKNLTPSLPTQPQPVQLMAIKEQKGKAHETDVKPTVNVKHKQFSVRRIGRKKAYVTRGKAFVLTKIEGKALNEHSVNCGQFARVQPSDGLQFV